MTLNRAVAPPYSDNLDIQLPIAEVEELAGGIKLYVVNAGFEPIAKIDVVFNAGLSSQLHKAEAIFTAAMLSEGTSLRSGKELADALDFYGAYFQVRCNADDSVATLYCLNKYVGNCLPLFFEALFLSVMPEKELKVVLDNAVQKLRINLKKNSFLAKNYFYDHVFGTNHPYAVNQTENDIYAINRSMLLSHFENNYKNGIKYLMIAGKVENKTIDSIKNEFKNWNFNSNIKNNKSEIKTSAGKYFYNKKGSVQSAVRIGRTTINRMHDDYAVLQLFNLLFGGYFGARLMKNIREDKGLTYGIYSVLESYLQTGCWYISTDINNELRNKGIEEIYKELHNVLEYGFSDEELASGKKYFIGSLLRGMDGVFSIAEKNKLLIDYNLNNNHYSELVNTINKCTNKDIIHAANQYISTKLVEVVVGE